MKRIICVATLIALLLLNCSTTAFAEFADFKTELNFALADASMIVEGVEYRNDCYLNYYEFYVAFRDGMDLLYYNDNATEAQYKEALYNLTNARSKLIRVESFTEVIATTGPATDKPTESVTTLPITESTSTAPTESEKSEPTTIEPTTEPVGLTSESTEATEPTILKKAEKSNPIKVTAKTTTVKAKKLKRSKVTVNALTVKKAKGEVKYKKLSGSKKLTVNKKGKITIKKGTKKGAYKIKIKITAKGTKKYKSKTVTKKVTVKVK